MCPQGWRESHAHATAVADTSVQSWIVVVHLQRIEARSIANGNTSRGVNSMKNMQEVPLPKRSNNIARKVPLLEKWEVLTKTPGNFPKNTKTGEVEHNDVSG